MIKRITVEMDKKEFTQLKKLKKEKGLTWRGLLKYGVDVDES